MILFLLWGIREIMHLAELAKRHFSFIKKAELVSYIQSSGCRKLQLLRHQDRACMVDRHTFFNIAQLAGVIIRTAEIIAIPTIRYRGAVNAVVGEQRILAEKFTETFAVPVPAPCRADPTATASVFVEIEKAATFKKSRLCNTRVFNFIFAQKML